MKYGDSGTAVREVQLKLTALGYELPRYGADGDLGDETLRAFANFMIQHSAERDINPREIDTAELAILERVWKQRDQIPSCVVDRRQHSNRKLDHGPRDSPGSESSWQLTRGVMLHQTACDMGEGHDRYNSIGAHMSILRSGSALWHHEFDRYIVHGNGGNAQCIGIEVNGYFEGVLGRIATLWQPRNEPRRTPMRPTKAQIVTLHIVIPWIAERVAAHGGKLRAIFPHRVASGDRDGDPGSELWQSVGIPMRDKLGLTDGGPGFTFPDDQGGSPIPVEWDPSRTQWRY